MWMHVDRGGQKRDFFGHHKWMTPKLDRIFNDEKHYIIVLVRSVLHVNSTSSVVRCKLVHDATSCC